MSGPGQRSRTSPLRVLAPVVLLAIACGIGYATRRVERHSSSPYPMGMPFVWKAGLSDLPVWMARSSDRLANLDIPLELGFRRGETLGQVLSDLGLEAAEAQRVIAGLSEHVDVRRLRPEDRYASWVDADGRVEVLRLIVTGKGAAEVRRRGDEWESSWSEFAQTAVLQVVRGALDGSLEASIANAGGAAALAYVMADVLQWDLDFNRDLRLGDRFAVLYEQVFLNGELYRVGRILALSYENRGRTLMAFRFGEDGGYYDHEGRPLQKLFLKSPLRYSRVTSGFTNRRFHPILKQYRPHYGVDYGAPVGTPVRVTANGVVQSAGWDNGGGKTVKVRHPNGYLTAYLHLSGFASGIRSGVRVAQGEVIGYVGSTGLSTAPHLDYRMQKNGRWINPQVFRSEPAEPIPAELLPEFEMTRDRFARSLTVGEPLLDEVDHETSRIAALDSP